MMMKYSCHVEIDGARSGLVTGANGVSLATPFLAYPVDNAWPLTTLELEELGVQCLKSSIFYKRQLSCTTIPGWTGLVILTSGIVEAELKGLTMKWTPDHVVYKNSETGEMQTQNSSEGCESAWLCAVMQPPVFPTTSQTRRKTVLPIAAAWKRASEEGRIPECCIQGDPELLKKLLVQQENPPGIVLWQAGADAIIPPTTLRWHAGISDWDDFLMRLYEGADILTMDFLSRYHAQGLLITSKEWVDITSTEYEFSQEPFDHDCTCRSCQDFTRSYLHHLWTNTPLLAQRILAIHNVFYLEHLIDNLRNALETGKFLSFTKQYPVVKRKLI